MAFETPSIGSPPDKIYSRRGILAGLVSSSLLAPSALAMQAPLGRRGTPILTIGPFYPVRRPPEEDADLTLVRGRQGRARGTVVEVAGRVLTEAGAPIAGATLDIWQANSAGRYDHPSDLNPAPLDPAFQVAALLRTDDQGRFQIRTVLPGPYAERVRHIHFDVRGRSRRLITQMFFPEEPNASDRFFRELATDRLREAVTARLLPAGDGGVPQYEWNIVLAGD